MATLATPTIVRKRADPQTLGERKPERDKPCPECQKDRGVIVYTFFYLCTSSTGKSMEVHWCPWHQHEVP